MAFKVHRVASSFLYRLKRSGFSIARKLWNDFAPPRHSMLYPLEQLKTQEFPPVLMSLAVFLCLPFIEWTNLVQWGQWNRYASFPLNWVSCSSFSSSTDKYARTISRYFWLIDDIISLIAHWFYYLCLYLSNHIRLTKYHYSYTITFVEVQRAIVSLVIDCYSM